MDYPKISEIPCYRYFIDFGSLALLGLYKGVIGYCPLTDWHWDVKRALGETNIPSSFIEYMVEKILGLNFPSLMIDVATVTGLVFGVVMSVVVYHKNVKSHSKEPHQMA